MKNKIRKEEKKARKVNRKKKVRMKGAKRK
jgi:hypothetical protein